MYNSDTEILFPLRVIPALSTLRGAVWKTLIERASAQGADPVDEVGFALMMVRLAGCVTCNSDSYRAMRGCTQCARQTVRRFRGEDKELVELFEACRTDVVNYRKKSTKKTKNSGNNAEKKECHGKEYST